MQNIETTEDNSEFLDCIEDYEKFKNKVVLKNVIPKNDLVILDALILSFVIEKWRKVAFVIAKTLDEIEKNNQLSIFKEYAQDADMLINQRIIELLNNQKFIAQGDVRAMRFSEIKKT